jgi:tetratricopeptide (TPR) repeat protein
MTDTSSNRTLMALLEPDVSAAESAEQIASGQLALPTLDERVEMFLHAVHGSEHPVTAEERASARDRILTAMAADIADKASGGESSATVPPISAATAARFVRTAPVRSVPPAAGRSEARASVSEILANAARSFLQMILAPAEVFAMRSVRMAAVPVFALMLLVAVWTETSVDFGTEEAAPENATPGLATNEAPPAVPSLPTSEAPAASQPTTRSLAPTQPSAAGQPLNLRSASRSSASEAALKRDISAAETRLGPNHPDVAKAVIDLANLYQSEGRYREAEALYNQALAIRQGAFGPRHPEVAQTLNDLALLYRAQGRIREADDFSRRARVMLESAQ